MKLHVCDVCLTDKKLVVSGWTFTHKRGAEKISVAICAQHKGTLNGKGYDAVLDIAVKAEQEYNAMAFVKGA
jgi:biotin synthase-related radical SAM superfamily protein